MAMKNIGRGETNIYAKTIKKVFGTYRYLTNFNLAERVGLKVKDMQGHTDKRDNTDALRGKCSIDKLARL